MNEAATCGPQEIRVENNPLAVNNEKQQHCSSSSLIIKSKEFHQRAAHYSWPLGAIRARSAALG